MAGTEERCGAARGDSRSARHQIGCALLGIAAALGFLAEASAVWAQESSPSASPGGASGTTGASPGGVSVPTGGGVPGGSRGMEWTITPSVSASETFTDNVYSTASQRRSDLISTLSPGLFINGESARLTGVFNYSPQLIKYLDQTSQDQILQNLFGNGTLTAIPELLFFDASANISNVSRSGGRGFNNAAPIATSQNTQTIAYTGSPYARFHFGDSGDAEVRYSISRMEFDGNTDATSNTVTGQTLGAISNSTQQVESAKYSTGEAFNLLQLTFLADNTSFRSGGSSLNSRDSRAMVNGSYQVTNAVQGLFGAGYEVLTYSQASGLNYRGPTWNIGARYAPRDDREVRLTYGQSQGRESFDGSAHYAVTARTVVSASYTEQTTTQQQQIAQNLALATQIAPGVTINKTTGLPEFITDPNLALQNSIIRSRNFQAGVTLTGERDRYTLTFSRGDQSGLSAGSLSQTTTGGIVSWGHDLSPDASGTVTASYSSTNSPTGTATTTAGSNIDAATLTMSLNYALSETLSAGANYAMSHQTGGFGGSVLVDLVTVSLRKSF